MSDNLRETVIAALRDEFYKHDKHVYFSDMADRAIALIGAELAKWCQEQAEDNRDGSAYGFRETANHIRRLSALPKGQEHEG